MKDTAIPATVERERTQFKGTIISFELSWEGTSIDLHKVRKLRIERNSMYATDSFIEMNDGTRIALYVARSGVFEFLLKGHIVLRVESLGKDFSFDVEEVEKINIPPSKDDA